jgi:hypoxanthine phosphoribosyltransferase
MTEPHRLTIAIRREQIAERIEWLVEEIAPSAGGEGFAMIGILRGSFMFLADLCRALHAHGVHPLIDFMTLESYYDGTESSGTVRIAKDCSTDLNGRRVLIVDDILDTGRTLATASDHLAAKGALSVQTCVLLDKPARRIVALEADYVGFTIEDRFVAGYGLDYAGHYRELPYLAEVVFEG